MMLALAILVLMAVGAAGMWTGSRVVARRWSMLWAAALVWPPLVGTLVLSIWLYRDQLWPAAGTLPSCRPGSECFGYGMFFSSVVLALLMLAWSVGFWRGRRSGRQQQGGNP